MPWGVAEDTGRSAVWLARHVGAWAESLADALALDPAASPLFLAGWLADAAEAVCHPHVAAPVWLLPPLLASLRRPFALRIDDISLHAMPGAASSASMPLIAISDVQTARIVIEIPDAPLYPLPHAVVPDFRRSRVSRAELARLDALARLTYVPASDHSRRTGAGAGLLDDA